MDVVAENGKTRSVPLIRKVIMPVFLVVCAILGLLLSEWAAAESVIGLTSGRWMVNSLDFQLVITLYALTGIISSGAGFWWLSRAIVLRVRRLPVWTDKLLTALFATAAVSFTLMNILHIGSEIIICSAGLVNECSF
jgi:hypothetical protein